MPATARAGLCVGRRDGRVTGRWHPSRARAARAHRFERRTPRPRHHRGRHRRTHAVGRPCAPVARRSSPARSSVFADPPHTLARIGDPRDRWPPTTSTRGAAPASRGRRGAGPARGRARPAAERRDAATARRRSPPAPAALAGRRGPRRRARCVGRATCAARCCKLDPLERRGTRRCPTCRMSTALGTAPAAASGVRAPRPLTPSVAALPDLERLKSLEASVQPAAGERADEGAVRSSDLQARLRRPPNAALRQSARLRAGRRCARRWRWACAAPCGCAAATATGRVVGGGRRAGDHADAAATRRNAVPDSTSTGDDRAGPRRGAPMAPVSAPGALAPHRSGLACRPPGRRRRRRCHVRRWRRRRSTRRQVESSRPSRADADVGRGTDRPGAAGRVLRRARPGRRRHRPADGARAQHRRREPAALPEAAGDLPPARRARAYERIRERFNRRFNAYAPEWGVDPRRGLDAGGLSRGARAPAGLWQMPSMAHGAARRAAVPPRRRPDLRRAGLPRTAVPLRHRARPGRTRRADGRRRPAAAAGRRRRRPRHQRRRAPEARTPVRADGPPHASTSTCPPTSRPTSTRRAAARPARPSPTTTDRRARLPPRRQRPAPPRR